MKIRYLVPAMLLAIGAVSQAVAATEQLLAGKTAGKRSYKVHLERGMITSNTYDDWFLDRVYLLLPAQSFVGDFLKTFVEYPPRQKAASFNLSQVMEKLQQSSGSH